MSSSPALRRLLHVASTGLLFLIPLGGLALFRWTVVGVALLAAAIETVRLSRSHVHDALAGAIPVFRSGEARRPTGAAWLAVGYALSAWLPPPGPQAGMLVGGLADPAASLVGSRWGHDRASSGDADGKSTVGTIAFTATAAAALLALGLEPLAVAGAAAAAALVERFSGPIDDNVVVPVVAGLIVVFMS